MPLSLLEMDQVSASLSKQDPRHPAKSNRDKVTRRQPPRWGSALTKSTHRSRAFLVGPSRDSSACWRADSLPVNRAVQGVDQHLNLDELVAGPFGLVAIERSGQHLRMPVPVLDHARTGFIQRFKSLTHFWLLSSEGLAPRCRRESLAYTDPAIDAIDQRRVVINRAYKKPASLAGFSLSFNLSDRQIRLACHRLSTRPGTRHAHGSITGQKTRLC